VHFKVPYDEYFALMHLMSPVVAFSCNMYLIYQITMSVRMRWAEHVGRMRDLRNAYSIFVGKPEGKRSL
jgi:hypothetical protein